MSKYYGGNETRGIFENITIDNVYASFSKGTVDVPGNFTQFIEIGSDLDISNLTINKLVRNESVYFNTTINVAGNTSIDNLLISDCVQTCPEGQDMKFFNCDGTIKSGKIQNISVNGTAYPDKTFD